MMTLFHHRRSLIVTLPSLVALFLLSAGRIDAQAPYAVVFDFADPSIPKDKCAKELNSISSNLYPTYIDNVIADTWWTSSTVSSIANHGVRRAEELAENDSQQHHRRLATCTVKICLDSPIVIIAAGCQKYCSRRRRNLRTQNTKDHHRNTLKYSFNTNTPATFSSNSSGVTSFFTSPTTPSFSYTYNQSNPAQGWKGNYAPYRGYNVATAFYNAVNSISSKTCRDLLSTMTYVLIDYE